MQSIDIFVNKVKKANRSKSKELSLSIEEANDLLIDITTILNKQQSLMNDIIKLHEQKVIQVDIDGGTL